MSILILTHVVTGLVGIVAGLIVIIGTVCRRRMARGNALFLTTTAAACVTGLVFLPASGITSAQIVALFSAVLLAVAAYAYHFQRLHGDWSYVYAFTAVGALFLNVLVATAQSFLHFQFLKTLAPTQHSPVYVAVKVALLSLFLLIAFVVAKRTGRHIPR